MNLNRVAGNNLVAGNNYDHDVINEEISSQQESEYGKEEIIDDDDAIKIDKDKFQITHKIQIESKKQFNISSKPPKIKKAKTIAKKGKVNNVGLEDCPLSMDDDEESPSSPVKGQNQSKGIIIKAENLGIKDDTDNQRVRGRHGSIRRLGSFSYIEEYSHSKVNIANRHNFENNKNIDKREKRDRAIRQKWINYQTQIQYHDDVTEQFKSIKDVFRSRIQFDKKAREERDKIKKKISRAEFDAYEPKVVSLNKKSKDAMKEKVNQNFFNDNAKKENKQLTMAETYDEAMHKVKDSKSFYVHGKIIRYSKTSLGLLDNRSAIRWYIVYLITDKRFENFILLMIIVNSIFLGIKDYTDVENKSTINKFVENSEPFFTYIFLFECMSRIIGMGFIYGNNSYLRDTWNWLDFIVVVTSLLQQLPDMKNMSGLRTFRLFKPLKSLTNMPSMKLLIGTLFSSLQQLGGILGLAIFFFMIFAILGVSLWDGKIHYRCYKTEWPDFKTGYWELVEGDENLCSQGFRSCPKGTFCNSRYEAYAQGKLDMTNKNINLNQDSDIENLNYGITNFDDIASAFLTIFQCITMEGWTKIMNIYQDAYAEWFVIIYFILCVVICAFFLLNLTIAVMLMRYEELEKSQAHSKHHEELKQIGMKIELPPKLIEFLIKQDSIQIQGGATSMLKGEDSFIKQLFQPKKPIEDFNQKYYKHPIVKVCYKIIFNQYFEAFIFFVIILNTFTLALDKYPDLNQDILDFLNILNIVFTVIFTTEVIVKLIGLGMRVFIKEKFNQFDTFVVVISLVDFQISTSDGPSIFSSLRAFRLFKLFKLFRVGDLRILLDSITFTLSTISDYVILLLLFIFVFALIGMSFFAGKIRFDEDGKVDLVNGELPRTHFDSIFWSVITIFQVMMGESWNNIMYDCMRSVSSIASVYFIGLVVTGNIIMLNLFLAILLGNFDKARNFQQKKKVFEAFKELKIKNKTLNETLDAILGETSMMIKTKILGWDGEQTAKLHTDGDTKIAQQLMEDGAQFMNGSETQKSVQILTEKQILSSARNDIFEDIAGIQKNQIRQLGDGESNSKVLDKKEQQMAKNQDSDAEQNEGEQNGEGKGKKNNKEDDQQKEETLNDKGKDKDEYKAYLKQFAKGKEINDTSKTIVKVHKAHRLIRRLREFNEQHSIEPYEGLKEVIEKKSIDGILKEIRNRNKQKKKEKEALLAYQNQKKHRKNFMPANLNESMKPLTQNQDNSQNFVLRQSKSLQQKKLPREMDELDNAKSKTARAMQSNSVGKKKNLTKAKSVNNANFAKKEKGPKMSDQIRQFQVAYYGSTSSDSEVELTLYQKFIRQKNEASLFIFNRNSKIRIFCLSMAEEKETIEEYQKHLQEGTLENYSQNKQNQKKQKGGMFAKTSKSSSINKNEKLRNPNKMFDNAVLTLILLSSILLAVDNPLNDPKSQQSKIIGYIDASFTILFTIEASIKIIAKGFAINRMGPIEPYIKSYWNILDFVVVVASLMDLLFMVLSVDIDQLKALKALRAFRALRPLRMIARNEGMKLVVNALLASLPSMTNVLLVCSLFILIFSIGGVNFFKGTFFRCENKFVNGITVKIIDLSKVKNKADCLREGGNWVNANSNFDNCIQAMSTLFQMTSTEGWVDVMYDGIDSVGVDQQPIKNNNTWFVIYFVAFMIIGSQFIINLFVGVVIDNFNTIKEREELGNTFVTDHQRSYIEIQKVGMEKQLKRKIKEPIGCSKYFFRLVNHKFFDYFITSVIVLNTIVMAIRHYQMPKELENFSEKINFVFTFIFNLEMILKLIGLRKVYFFQYWNIFDMFIVFSSDIGIVLDQLELGQNFSTTMTIFRAFRIMRMFKLIRSSPHMRLILDTVFNILPQITNVMSLILLLFFIYAALGINLFSSIMAPQDALDKNNNFQTFFNAMVILMKFSTGEDWNQFMYELANTDGFHGQKCKENQTYEEYKEGQFLTCGTYISYPYFFSFTIIVTMLIMNLSVAAVIEGLNTAKNENMGVVQGDEIDRLIELWQDYDNDATGYITMQDLVFLLYELPPPLGKRSARIDSEILMAEQNAENQRSQGIRHQERYLVHKEKKIIMKKRDALDLLSDLKIKVHEDSVRQIYWVDVFKALIKRVFVDKKLEYKLSDNLSKKMKSNWDKKHKTTHQKTSDYNAQKQQAGMIITKWAKKILYKNKDTFHKENKSYKAKKVNTNQPTKKNNNNSTSNQKTINQIYQDQAKIIFSMIKQETNGDQLNSNRSNNQYKVKNEYTWKQAGGSKLLQHLYDEDSDDIESDTNSGFGQSPSRSEKTGELELYGEKTKAYLQKNGARFSDDSFPNPNNVEIEISKLEQSKYDLDETQTKEIYKPTRDGEYKIDKQAMQRFEKDQRNKPKSISIKDTCEMNDEDDKAKKLSYQDISNRLQEKYKQEKQRQEEQEEERMIQKITKNTKTQQDGGNNETITFDERMLDDEQYQKLCNQRNQAMKNNDDAALNKLMLKEDFSLSNNRLKVESVNKLDLFTTAKNIKFQNKVESARMRNKLKDLEKKEKGEKDSSAEEK